MLIKNTLEFACCLGRMTKSKVTGVFLENLAAEEKPLLKQMQGMDYTDWEVYLKSDKHKAKMELTDKNISFFKEGRNNREVSYSLHRERWVPAKKAGLLMY